MSKRVVKRKPQRRGKSASRGRGSVRKSGLMDRMMKLVPLTDQQVQRGMTAGLVGVFILGAFTVAHYSGFNGYVSDQAARGVANGGFEVKRVEVTGVNRIDELSVYDVALAQKDRSMLRVDVDDVRDELMANGWIKDARVTRRLPDMLAIDIEERQPVAIWKRGEELSLIDDTGATLENLDARDLPDLPVVMGARVNEQAEALNELLDAAPALRPQIAGAVWIGNRRWNLEFASGETLALPEGKQRAVSALVEFARMDGVNRLLGGRFSHFDLRSEDRMYARLPDTEKVVAVSEDEI